MPNAAAKQKIKSALAELLEEKDFEKITVQDIVRRAKINRTTYYYHYYEQEEVLDDIFEDIFKVMNSCDLTAISAHDNFVSVGNYILDNRKLLSSLIFGSAKTRFKERYHAFFITAYNEHAVNNFGETYNAMRAEYIFAGQYQLLEYWMQTEITETVNDYINVSSDVTERLTSHIFD